jgi:putative endonuclease
MNQKIGKIGEDLACAYLINRGYRVLVRNYRKKFGEIDVVAQSRQGTLIFCEVKTIVQNQGYSGWLMQEDNLTVRKAEKMRRAAQFFAAQNPGLIKEEKGWRIDLVAITLKDDQKTVKEIHHYKNI